MCGGRPGVVRVLTGHLVYICSFARPLLYRFQAHSLDRWRSISRADLRTLAGLVCSPSASWVGRSPMLCFARMPCSKDTTASFEELKEATRFRERWRFRVREISQTLPVRHADEIARLGALSPLGGHSRDGVEEPESSQPTKGFGRSANFEEVMTAYGSWPDRQGVRTNRTSVRASSPKAVEVEECVGVIRRLPATWNNPSRWHTVIKGDFKFKEAIHMKEGRAALMGLRRAVAATGWARSSLSEPHRQYEQLACLRPWSLMQLRPALSMSPCSCSVYWRRRVMGPSAPGNPAWSFRRRGSTGPWLWSRRAYAELYPATCPSTCFWNSRCPNSRQP